MEPLTEDQALALLASAEVSSEQIEAITSVPALMKSRRVLLAVVAHARTPKHVSLPRARHLYTFELMQVALSPAVPADVKLFAEELLLTRLPTITAGERLALAKRASTRVASTLLQDSDSRVVQAALNNPRITEAAIVQALKGASVALVHAVCRHPGWPLRWNVQIALLRNPHTPASRAAYFAGGLSTTVLRDVLPYAPDPIRMHIEQELWRRKTSPSETQSS